MSQTQLLEHVRKGLGQNLEEEHAQCQQHQSPTTEPQL